MSLLLFANKFTCGPVLCDIKILEKPPRTQDQSQEVDADLKDMKAYTARWAQAVYEDVDSQSVSVQFCKRNILQLTFHHT